MIYSVISLLFVVLVFVAYEMIEDIERGKR